MTKYVLIDSLHAHARTRLSICRQEWTSDLTLQLLTHTKCINMPTQYANCNALEFENHHTPTAYTIRHEPSTRSSSPHIYQGLTATWQHEHACEQPCLASCVLCSTALDACQERQSMLLPGSSLPGIACVQHLPCRAACESCSKPFHHLQC